MLQTMQLREEIEPVERSFIQQMILKNNSDNTKSEDKLPPLTIVNGLDRNLVYETIISTKDSLNSTSEELNDFFLFKKVNKELIEVLEKESMSHKEGILWTFYIPFFTYIVNSNYYDTYCRYISVSYFPESYEWWENNPDAALNFIMWFENGEDN